MTSIFICCNFHIKVTIYLNVQEFLQFVQTFQCLTIGHHLVWHFIINNSLCNLQNISTTLQLCSQASFTSKFKASLLSIYFTRRKFANLILVMMWVKWFFSLSLWFLFPLKKHKILYLYSCISSMFFFFPLSSMLSSIPIQWIHISNKLDIRYYILYMDGTIQQKRGAYKTVSKNVLYCN